jgi:hypothetical protein
MNHGGKRHNAGRKKLYGPTKRIVRLIPIAWLQEFEEWLEAKRKEAVKLDCP